MDDIGAGGGALTERALSCGACGTELPPDSRFCNKCGAPIAPAATTAEYKQVTVLFGQGRVGLALPLAGRVPGGLAVADNEDAAHVHGGSRHGRRRYGEG